MSVRLEQLLADATPGPWRVGAYEIFAGGRVIGKTTEAMLVQDAALIALAPDMARLLIDMGAMVQTVRDGYEWKLPMDEEFVAALDALLARRDALGKDMA